MRHSRWLVVYRRDPVWIPFLVAIFLILTLSTVFWVGYQGSDDGSYIDAAQGWLRDFPHLGHSHWSLRYPIVLPIAASLALLGQTVVAVALPFMLALTGTVLITVWAMVRRLGQPEAMVFVLLFLTLPGALVLATFVSDDIMELFLVIASLMLFLAAEQAVQRWPFAVASGLCAGLAFLTRETSAGLILAYGMLFLIRPGIPRRLYVLMGVAFCAIVFAQTAFIAAMTGDWLYRFHIDATHDVVNRVAVVAHALAAGHVVDDQGNLVVSAALDPILMFLVSQKYGLAFYLGIAGCTLLFRRRLQQAERSLLVATVVLGVSWSAFIVANQHFLYLVPRYILVPAWCACVLGGALIGRWWREGRRWLATLVLGVALAVNSAALLVENTDPIQSSKAALAAASKAREPVWTDPITARRGRFLRQIEGLDGRLRAGPPPRGALFAYAPDDVARCAHSPECGMTAVPYTPQPGWTVVERDIPAPRPFGLLLRATGLALSPQLWQKIVQPNAGMILYRTN